LCLKGVGATVSSTIREAREAVEALHADHPEGVPASIVAQELNLDRSAARRRLIIAIDAGYVLNLEERRGRPGRYVPGDHLPDDMVLLPLLPSRHPDRDETAGQADDGMVASVSEGVSEEVALDVLKRELGATGNGQADPQAEFIQLWNADVFKQGRVRREAEKEETR
jgi:hypothetical protein